MMTWNPQFTRHRTWVATIKQTGVLKSFSKCLTTEWIGHPVVQARIASSIEVVFVKWHSSSQRKVILWALDAWRMVRLRVSGVSYSLHQNMTLELGPAFSTPCHGAS